MAFGRRRRHLNLRDILEHSSAPVLAVIKIKELRRLINELGVALALDKPGVGHDFSHKGDVGLDAFDMHLV
ncbi:hypothetical protein SDC9_84887 [bioreactor metagenome]|uniref:Uncharacterized protein n=1 Tax=bioreactor metagenome TaxID=1076179 RepID=A0A644ZD62_9ZZZZ